MIDDECGAVGGMRIGRGKQSTKRKPTPVPLYPPQIPHNLTWARTQAAAVESLRLTARAMARSTSSYISNLPDLFPRGLQYRSFVHLVGIRPIVCLRMVVIKQLFPGSKSAGA
jgi:hypothetical protein